MRLTRLFVIALALLLSSCWSVPVEHPLGEPNSKDALLRGGTLVNGLAACGFCHGATAKPYAALSGGLPYFDRYGEVLAPNITPDQTGIGAESVSEVMRAIRASLYPNGSAFSSLQAHRGYEWMSDTDALAIAGYIRAQPPVTHQVTRRSVNLIKRYTEGFFESRGEVAGIIPDIPSRFPVQYGEYLVEHVARCMHCHNGPEGIISNAEYLGGGQIIRRETGEKVAPAINASKQVGLGEWNEDEIVQYLQTGLTRNGEHVDPAFCPVDFFKNAPQHDLQAIAAYLKSVTAQ